MPRTDGIRLLFVTGKGGVGKTTVSCACGLAAAALGWRVLLVAPAASRGLFRLCQERRPLSPLELQPGLALLALEPESAMQKYAADLLHSESLAGLLFQKNLASGLLRGIPGLSAWALLGQAFHATRSQDKGPRIEGAPYDLVIFDAPSTGDGTDLLRLPDILLKLGAQGRFREDARQCRELLHDPRRFCLLPVSLPELLPMTETAELVASARAMGLRVGPWVLNRLERPLLGGLERRPSSQQLELMAPWLRARWERELGQAEQLALARQAELAPIEFPLLEQEPLGLEQYAGLPLEELQRRLFSDT